MMWRNFKLLRSILTVSGPFILTFWSVSTSIHDRRRFPPSNRKEYIHTMTKSIKMKSKVRPASWAHWTALTAEVPSSASSITAFGNVFGSSSMRRMIFRLSAESSWRSIRKWQITLRCSIWFGSQTPSHHYEETQAICSILRSFTRNVVTSSRRRLSFTFGTISFIQVVSNAIYRLWKDLCAHGGCRKIDAGIMLMWNS